MFQPPIGLTSARRNMPASSRRAFAWEAGAGEIKAYVEANLRPGLNKKATLALSCEWVFIGDGTVSEGRCQHQRPGHSSAGTAKIPHKRRIRDNVLIGDGGVIGNSTELKNACSSTSTSPRTSLPANPSSATKATSGRRGAVEFRS